MCTQNNFFFLGTLFEFDKTSYVYNLLSSQHRGQILLKSYSVLQNKINKRKSSQTAIDNADNAVEEGFDSFSEEEAEFIKTEKYFNIFELCKILIEREIETNGYE